MNSYCYFNRALISDIEFPELAPLKSGDPGFKGTIHLNHGLLDAPETLTLIHEWRAENGEEVLDLRREGDDYRLTSPDALSVRISHDGHQMTVMPTCDDPVHIREQLLDQILPRVLTLAPCVILHASCVTKNGRTLAFCGPTGAGKSTLAAGFQKAGWQLMTDDCLMLNLDARNTGSVGRIFAAGAYPGLRLMPDSAVQFGEGQQLPTARASDKVRTAEVSEQPSPAPLTQLFLVGERSDEISFSKASGADGLMKLLDQTFAFNPADLELATDRMKRIAHILRYLPPVKSFVYPHDYAQLDACIGRLTSVVDAGVASQRHAN